MSSEGAFEALVLLVAWAAALTVRPWRLLRPHEGQVRLATPLLATLVVLPWLWSWPGLGALPVAVQWSGAPLVVLLLGWPLAVPVLTVAGFTTMLTSDATAADALSTTAWMGLLPATLALGLGSVVRKAFGAHPVAYMLGRGFFVPMLALVGCALAAAPPGGADSAGELQLIASLLLAMGEASMTCAVASTLVAWRPHWLATWSDSLYLSRPRPRAHPHR